MYKNLTLLFFKKTFELLNLELFIFKVETFLIKFQLDTKVTPHYNFLVYFPPEREGNYSDTKSFVNMFLNFGYFL